MVLDGPGVLLQSAEGPKSAALLAGAQFFAIGWVVLNQFRDHLGLEVGARSGLVAKGYLGAALFIVLSGFLVCRRYERLRSANLFDYGDFLWRRFSFAYPLHLTILLGLAGFAGEAIHHASFGWRDLPANLLLVQAWGALRTDSWNFPSWLISAEWFAYLVFPLTAWVALRGLRRASFAVAASIAIFILMFLLSARAGILFTDMTTRIGALQTVPAFLLGAALWRLGRERAPASSAAAILALTALVWIVAAATWRFSDLVIWPAFAPLVFGLAHIRAVDGQRPLRYLGQLSIAMMLIYLPVDIAYFRVARFAFGTPKGAEAWLIWSGVFPAIVLAAVVAHHGLQRPLWLWLQVHRPFDRRAKLGDPT